MSYLPSDISWEEENSDLIENRLLSKSRTNYHALIQNLLNNKLHSHNPYIMDLTAYQLIQEHRNKLSRTPDWIRALEMIYEEAKMVEFALWIYFQKEKSDSASLDSLLTGAIIREPGSLVFLSVGRPLYFYLHHKKQELYLFLHDLNEETNPVLHYLKRIEAMSPNLFFTHHQMTGFGEQTSHWLLVALPYYPKYQELTDGKKKLANGFHRTTGSYSFKYEVVEEELRELVPEGQDSLLKWTPDGITESKTIPTILVPMIKETRRRRMIRREEFEIIL